MMNGGISLDTPTLAENDIMWAMCYACRSYHNGVSCSTWLSLHKYTIAQGLSTPIIAHLAIFSCQLLWH